MNKEVKAYLKVLLFIMLFIFGLFLLKDVGANFDEDLEMTILKRNLAVYADKFDISSIKNSDKMLNVEKISSNSEKDHGIATYYFFTPILFNSNSHLSFYWHLYTFMIFFIGLIYLHKLVYYLYKNKTIAYLTTLLYYFSPRILVDSFSNNKDIVFMSLLIIMIYYVVRFIKEKNLKNALLFAIVSSFVCNIKVLGLFFFGIFGLLYLFMIIKDKEFNKRNVFYGFLIIFICLSLYVFITPAIWGNGKFELVSFIKYCLNNATNFRGEPTVLFEGVYYKSTKLPWYYLPKYMIITLPIITSVLFIYGLVLYIKKLVKKEFDFDSYLLTATILCFLVPFMICITKHPVIYNGWRHFYFLISFMFVFIPFAIKELLSIKKLNYLFMIFISITLICNLYYLCNYKIKNTAYFNILVNRNHIEKRYELDYYDSTFKNAFDRFYKDYSFDNKIYLYGSDFNNRILYDLVHIYPDYNEKVEVIDKKKLKKLLKKKENVYEISNTVYGKSDYKKRLIYSYKIFNSNITNIYQLEVSNE